MDVNESNAYKKSAPLNGVASPDDKGTHEWISGEKWGLIPEEER